MTIDEINIKFREAVKKGKENGKALHYSEAFKLFPVEEEDHQGKIEYWTEEEAPV